MKAVSCGVELGRKRLPYCAIFPRKKNSLGEGQVPIVVNDAICGCFECILLEPGLQPGFHPAGKQEAGPGAPTGAREDSYSGSCRAVAEAHVRRCVHTSHFTQSKRQTTLSIYQGKVHLSVCTCFEIGCLPIYQYLLFNTISRSFVSTSHGICCRGSPLP